MAIISCPSCKEKISDKAKVCSSCQYDLVNRSTSDGLNEEQLASKQRLAHIKRKYSLQMQAMVGIIMVLGGALAWYFNGRDSSSVKGILSLTVLAAGSALYLATRVRLILFKKKK